MRSAGVPTPEGRTVTSPDDAWDAAQDIGLPVVVKPIDGNHGKGNTTNITDREQAIKALEAAKNYGNKVTRAKVDFHVLRGVTLISIALIHH